MNTIHSFGSIDLAITVVSILVSTVCGIISVVLFKYYLQTLTITMDRKSLKDAIILFFIHIATLSWLILILLLKRKLIIALPIIILTIPLGFNIHYILQILKRSKFICNLSTISTSST
jgi:hypothetical protein